jgi:hypothetical protein
LHVRINSHDLQGCVPVYVGAPNIDDIAPRGSFINANNLTSTEIATEITKFLNDSQAWAIFYLRFCLDSLIFVFRYSTFFEWRKLKNDGSVLPFANQVLHSPRCCDSIALMILGLCRTFLLTQENFTAKAASMDCMWNSIFADSLLL